MRIEAWRATVSFAIPGTKLNRPDKAVTLIEEETLEIAAAELGIEMFADKTRRNIVTRGVPLIDLLHREFVIGGVIMRGLRLFEPCGHLEKVSKDLRNISRLRTPQRPQGFDSE